MFFLAALFIVSHVAWNKIKTAINILFAIHAMDNTVNIRYNLGFLIYVN